MNPKGLSREARKVLENPELEKYISDISFYEISNLLSTDNLKTDIPFELFVKESLIGLKCILLPIKHKHLAYNATMPVIMGKKKLHTDPVDRLLVAQATVESLTIITSDEIIPKYTQIKTLW